MMNTFHKLALTQLYKVVVYIMDHWIKQNLCMQNIADIITNGNATNSFQSCNLYM